MRFFYLTCLVLVVTISCNQQSETAPLVPSTDIELIGELYQNTLYQINTASEAVTRSTSPKTKSLAENILKEKAVIKSELEELAGRKAFDLPLDISSAQLEKWQEVVREKGWDFDLKFLNTYLEMHERELQLMDKVVKNAKDEDVKKTTSKLLLNEDDHPELAIEIKQFIDSRLNADSATVIITKNAKE